MEKILVLGASGHCGRKVSLELLARGYKVVVLYRSSPPQLDSTNVEMVKGDANRRDDLENAMRGVSGVVNCIGFGKGTGGPTTFFSTVNKTLLETMRLSGVRQLVTMSNVGVFKTGNRLIYGFLVPIFMKWLQFIIDDKEVMETDLQENKEIDWVCPRFPNIVDGELKTVRSDTNGKSISLSITTESVGRVMVDLLEDSNTVHSFPCFSN